LPPMTNISKCRPAPFKVSQIKVGSDTLIAELPD
jgi:hypothetical protein